MEEGGGDAVGFESVQQRATTDFLLTPLCSRILRLLNQHPSQVVCDAL